MNADQLNALCAAYDNVDGASVHSATGIDDSNMIGGVQALSWTTPAGGVMTASATFDDVTDTPRYMRLWDGSVFIEELPINGGVGVDIVGQDLVVMIQHRAKA